MKLPEVDPSVFALYLHHVYVANFPVTTHSSPSETPSKEVKRGRSEYLQLAKLYVLTELLQDITMNTTLKAFVRSVFKVREDGHWSMPDAECTRIITKERLSNHLFDDSSLTSSRPAATDITSATLTSGQRTSYTS